MEVTKRISNLYGLKPGPDFEIKYARKSVDEPIISSHKDAPHSEIPPADYDYDLDAISADKVKSLFKDFVLLGNPKISLQDRRARTRELIKLIGPDTLIIQT
jgi:hypothetical protein